MEKSSVFGKKVPSPRTRIIKSVKIGIFQVYLHDFSRFLGPIYKIFKVYNIFIHIKYIYIYMNIYTQGNVLLYEVYFIF